MKFPYKTGANGLKKWEPVKPCLDLDDEGEDALSFKRDKDGNLKRNKKGEIMLRITSSKTIDRLINGCERHVFKEKKEGWIMTYYGGEKWDRTKSMDDTIGTVPTENRHSIVNIEKANLIDNYFGNGFTKPVTDPANVSGTKDGQSLHTVGFLLNYNHSSNSDSIDGAAPTVLGSEKYGIGQALFISQNYTGHTKNFGVINPSRAITGTGGNLNILQAKFIQNDYSKSIHGSGVEHPNGAITKIPHQNIVDAKFILNYFSSGGPDGSVDSPSPATMGIPKQRVVDTQFIYDSQFNNPVKGINEESKTVTASRKHYYLVSAHWFEGTIKSIYDPSGTIIARMDKAPPYLIITEMGELAIEVYAEDPPHYVKMKKFMAENGIISIKMRMLKIPELMKIQTLPEDYKFIGSDTDRKKMIGNAVPSKLVTALAKAYDEGTNENAA